ncbi:MAG: serine/threonine-protein kinase, partial [Holophagales bacterium]|nr:serine/threonine-protein kinase [Holophagales bacterium]
MTPERWRLLGELFAEAAELEPAEQGRFLDRACQDQPRLRREVEEMLASDRRAGSFLEPTTEADGPSSRPFWLGRRVAAYEILEEIGRGGMGTVYLARRADDAFEQRVALKVIQQGADSEQVVARFHQERQILASLQHPNIAHLLDGGSTEEGLPFFVMEYVEGESIDHHCDRRQLRLDDRLRLFETVCRAVQLAHRNLVVHRDLKTSNILVDTEGAVKLLDFGIAKISEPGTDSGLTISGVRPMTPEIASPEQVLRQPITTSTDVYSLGILLYELLVGRRPFRLQEAAPQELERAICHTEPLRPSQAVARMGSEQAAQCARHRDTEPARLQRDLRGDLDTIVLMALRKEPERRYPSALDLADDCRRFLAGLPVRARDDTWAYRAGKLIRRRPWVSTAALLALLGALGFTLALYLQGQRVIRERDRAQELALSLRRQQLATERQRQRTEEGKEFLLGLFRDTNPGQPAGRLTVRELLDRGAARLEASFEDQPLVEAALRETVASVYMDLSVFDAAEKHLNRALELRLGSGKEKAELTETYNNLGRLHFKLGRLREALGSFEHSLELSREVFDPESIEVAMAMNGTGTALYRLGEYSAARKAYRQSLEIRRRLLGNEHLHVAQSLMNLGVLNGTLGELATAEAQLRESLTIRTLLEGSDTQHVAIAQANLGSLLTTRGDYATAQQLLTSALTIQQTLFGNE